MIATIPVPDLGPAHEPSPMAERKFVDGGDSVLIHYLGTEIEALLSAGKPLPAYELAGPRERTYFRPAQVSAAIVTCGGLCPGLNDVLRAIYMELYHGYGVRRILGLRYGYAGLNPDLGHSPLLLDHDLVDDIHRQGGTILGSSRGPQDPVVMADFLEQEGINLVFPIGGDGTMRGAQALYAELRRRRAPIAVVGVPKSIDNDIACIEKTFGFETAVSESRDAIVCAHNEAKGALNGVGLVKLMGRHAGFIAAYATLANSEVNLVLVPEVAFALDGPGGVLAYIEERLRRRRHAVVVVAEGAGQHLFDAPAGVDVSGNLKLHDIGPFLKSKIQAHCERLGLETSVKYMDPSYLIRSVAATADDSVFCLRLGQNAVHAAMAGKTGILIGLWNSQFTHVPLEMATAERRCIDPEGWLWHSVCQATGQHVLD